MRKIRLGTILLICCLLLQLVPPVHAANVISRGKVNDLQWTLDSQGVLTFQGTGAIPDYIKHFEFNESGFHWEDRANPPWQFEGSTGRHLEGLIQEVIVTEGITGVGSGAFEGCPNLVRVSLPSTVQSIGTSAFRNCANLTNVQLPSSLKSMGNAVFYGCSSLSSIVFPSGVETVPPYTFRDCGNLRSVSLPNDIFRIEDCAFQNCTSLSSFNVPYTVHDIGVKAFYGCTSLSSVSLGQRLENIGEDAFANCNSLRSLSTMDHQRERIPAKSNNCNANNYTLSTSPTQSFLYQDGDELVRVEFANYQLFVERYTKDFQLLSSQSVRIDSKMFWGGFFAGDTYNFVFNGWENPEESKSAGVISVKKYSKNWNLINGMTLSNINTELPFYSGALRCVEADGILYVFTCHRMFQSEDGKNHQANLLFSIRESDLDLLDMHCVPTSDYGYVSHSFNQFMILDSQSRLVTLDHGDKVPRSLLLQRYSQLTGDGITSTSRRKDVEEAELLAIPNNTVAYQQTGVSIGGLAETTYGYVSVFNDNRNGGQNDSKSRNVYLSFTDRSNFSSQGTNLRQITSYGESTSAGTPMLVSTGLNGGYILWNEQQRATNGELVPTERIAYASYDAHGNVSSITTAAGSLSDCQPIVLDGKVVWYSTDGLSLTFYTLDSSGLKSFCQTPYKDNPENTWYHNAVQFVGSKGWFSPTDWTVFSPERTATRLDIAEALYRLDGCPQAQSAPFADVLSESYSFAPSWAAQNQILSGYGDGYFGPDDAVTREQLATILYHYAAYQGKNVSQRRSLAAFTDRETIHSWAEDALSWAYAVGLMSGSGPSTMSPLRELTRGELAAVLMNFQIKIL